MNKQSESQKKYKLYNKFKSICVFCTFLICVSQTSYAQKERAIIYGKVIDQVSGKPILSGTISILRKDKEVGTLKTSIEGIYSAIMIPGNYDFKAYCTGYMSNQKQDINVIDGDSLQLNFSLKERHDFLLGSSPQSELEFLGELQELSNTEVSISNEVIIKSPSIKSSSLTNKASKKLPVKEKLTIAPAKYDVYRNKEAKSPFRYPVAKIPMVAKNDALEKLIENISKGKLPNDDNELKEIIIEDLVNSMDYNYPTPKSNIKPFKIYTELFPCPWNEEKRLLHIGIQALTLDSRASLTEQDRPMSEDVNINVEFNPAYVTDYRLVGYEDYFPNLLSYWTDPLLDATMITGQTLTAIYEFTPTQNKFADEDQKLLYQNRSKALKENNELGAVQIFYRAPSAMKKWKIKHNISRFLKSSDKIEERTFLAVSIAEIAMRLKESPYIKTGTTNDILKRLRAVENLTEKGHKILKLVVLIQKLEAIE